MLGCTEGRLSMRRSGEVAEHLVLQLPGAESLLRRGQPVDFFFCERTEMFLVFSTGSDTGL